jgi:cell division protein FtsQ
MTRALPVLLCAVAALVVIFVGYRTTNLLAHASVLRIGQINVHGNQRLSQADVHALLTGLIGENLVEADLNQWRQRLMASPWVRDAALRRMFPSTVDVVVWERQPLGVARLNGDMYLMDERGVLIDRYGPQYADLDLPIVDGLAPQKNEDGSLADSERAELASRVIASLAVRPDIAKRLSQVDVSDLRNATVILAGDTAVIELGDDQFLQRLQGYLELATGLRTRVAEIDRVDARFENRLYVRPATAEESRERRSAVASSSGSSGR